MVCDGSLDRDSSSIRLAYPTSTMTSPTVTQNATPGFLRTSLIPKILSGMAWGREIDSNRPRGRAGMQGAIHAASGGRELRSHFPRSSPPGYNLGWTTFA